VTGPAAAAAAAPDPALAERIAAADRALLAGQATEARAILEQAAREAEPALPEFWQRLATLRQRTGAPALALAAIAGCAANAMFSLLAPRTHIPPHVGVANFRLIAHLPLIVPNRCWFRVGAETRDFAEAQAWVSTTRSSTRR
jgi:hypothetical protein